MHQDRMTRFTKYLLDFMFFSGLAVILTLPASIGWYAGYNTYFKTYYWELVVLFFLSGVFAVLIIGELRKLFASVLADNCFIRENVKSLDRMGNYSFAIALLTVCRVALYLTPAVMIVILVFVIAGLFSKVLSRVFDKAVSFKLENDLTI